MDFNPIHLLDMDKRNIFKIIFEVSQFNKKTVMSNVVKLVDIELIS